MSVYAEPLAIARSRQEIAENELKNLEFERRFLVNRISDLDKTIDYLAKLLEYKSRDSIQFMIDLVNDGLKSIFFDQNLSIRFDSSIKNNKLQYKLIILNDGVEGSNESFGGGVLAVISMIFRFAIAHQMKLAKLLVFDESLSFVSAQYRDNVSEFLNAIAKRFGYAIILISHDFGASKVYVITKGSNGFSRAVTR